MSRHTCRRVLSSLLVAFIALSAVVLAEPGGRRDTVAGDGWALTIPDGWRLAEERYRNVVELRPTSYDVYGPTETYVVPRVMITVEPRSSLDASLARLKQIEAEREEAAEFVEVSGWPALVRTARVVMDKPGPDRDLHGGPTYATHVTVAVALADRIVRAEGVLPNGADAALVTEMLAIGRAISVRPPLDRGPILEAIESLRAMPRLDGAGPERSPGGSPTEDGPGAANLEALEPEPSRARPARGRSMPALTTDGAPRRRVRGGGSSAATSAAASVDGAGAPGLVQRMQSGGGVDAEVEIAVSPDGMNIVVANNARDYAVSNDGGQTFATGVAPGVTGGGANGDPSLAWAADGNFYFGFIGFPSATTCSTGIDRSTDNGQTFTFRSNATICDEVNGPTCFPDQEHIAADRVTLSGTGQGQLYSTWRDFSGGGCGNMAAIAGPEIPSLVCSTDGGMTWTAKIAVGNAGDAYPRITVGQDGFVYVIYRAGNNIMLNKYSSCDSGLAQQMNFPTTIAAGITRVTCPAVPGLDRCNNGSDLTSHMIAVDDTDPSHLYVAYALSTNANVNEDVFVRDSQDGGLSWPNTRVVQLNTAVNGRRFMPWVCAVDGEACVSWYDMRAATAVQNDLADFYGGSAALDGTGNLVAGAEFQINTATDALCASGWPAAPRNPQDSESCSVQPQLAGVCLDTMGNSVGTRCDFSDCGTAACNMAQGMGASCQCNVAADEVCGCGRGVPKYGDYNGNACAAGRFYVAWASATSPPEIMPASTSIDTFFSIEKNQPPVAVCTDVTVSADASCVAEVTADQVDGGSSDPEGFDIELSLAPPGPYPLGDTMVTLTVTDDRGETDTCTATITVVDDTPPDVTAPDPITLECNAAGGIPASDPQIQAWLAQASAVDNCDGALPVSNDAPDFFPSACPPGQSTVVTFTATDMAGNSDSEASSVTVQDTTAPLVSCSVEEEELWPPNHKLVDVGFEFTATDACDAGPLDIAITVASDEDPLLERGSGGPRHCPDAVFDEEGVLLRAERAGTGDGRVYAITVQATDECGNAASCTALVTVPKSRGPNGAAVDSGTTFDATQCLPGP